MENENLNLAIADLYESLKEVDAAREQVEKVTSSANNLVKSTFALSKAIEAVATGISSDISNATSKIDKSVIDFKNEIDSKTAETKSQLLSEISGFKSKADQLLNDCNNSVKEIENIAKKNIENHTVTINELIDKLNSYSDQIQNLIKVISEMQLPERLDKVEAGLDGLKKSLTADLKSFKDEIRKSIDDGLDSLNSTVVEFKTDVETNFSNVNTQLSILNETLNSFKKETTNKNLRVLEEITSLNKKNKKRTAWIILSVILGGVAMLVIEYVLDKL